MKHISILMLALLFVACGKDNSSGGSGVVRNVDPLLNEAGAKAELVQLVNNHRARLGLPKLRQMPPHELEAEDFAHELAATGLIHHNGMSTRCARVRASVGGNACGEVVTRGLNMFADDAFDSWMNSWGHRSRLEDGRYNTVGVGAAQDRSGRLYWVMLFLQR